MNSEEMSIEDMFQMTVEEARDRLSSGVANTIDEVVNQLLDERILLQHHEEALRRSLDQER